MTATRMRILVVDDHRLCIDGLRHLLGKLDKDVVIETARTAAQAIRQVEGDAGFDLALLDLTLPDLDGVSILRHISKLAVPVPVVVVSAAEDVAIIQDALDAGALGFIPKGHDTREMLSALRIVLDGGIYVPPDIRRQLDALRSARNAGLERLQAALADSGITRRQHEVLRLLAQGAANKEIADRLFLTEHTVKSHIHALFSALKARNRTECVRFARERGMLDS